MFLASLLVELLLAVILVAIISVIIGLIIGLDPILSMVSGFVVVALVLVVRYTLPDPVDTFTSAVITPVPHSVTILKVKNSGIFDRTIWLHYTIAQNDLQQFLTSQDCTITPYGRDRHRNNPSWWKPEQLGEGTRIDTCVDDEWGKSLSVNAALTDVYHFASYHFRAD